MKQILQQMVEIVHLSPARQAQIYFKVEADAIRGTLSVNTATDYFLEERSGPRDDSTKIAEAAFHLGLAIGSLEEWLRDERINYNLEETFKGGYPRVKVTLI
jgi:hypothetical protein